MEQRVDAPYPPSSAIVADSRPRRTEVDRLAETRQAFLRAVAASPTAVREFTLRFGGRGVLIRVVGPALESILRRAFAQLGEVEPLTDAPALVVHAWDRRYTSVGCPGIPHVPDRTDVLGPGLMHQYDGGVVLRYERSTIVKSLDRQRRALYLCVEDAQKLGLNDQTKPFPHFLATWYLDRGIHLVHAGLVSIRGKGVLIGGTGGSGKSTVAIACALAGFDFLGDDTVGTVVSAEGCIGHACYNVVRSSPRVFEWFPRLAEVAHLLPRTPADKGKLLFSMAEVPGVVAPRSTTIQAIVLPTVRGSGTSQLVPSSGANALRLLAPSTLMRGLGGGVVGFAHMADMARRLPCFELNLGATPVEVPDLLIDMLESLPP